MRFVLNVLQNVSLADISMQIKDAARTLRLRKRKSLRGRIRNATDRSLGWIIITIVGFLTAVIAFLIIRSEQWLFDLKEGFCHEGFWKAKRFCCPLSPNVQSYEAWAFPLVELRDEDSCAGWRTWAEVFGPKSSDGRSWREEKWVIEYFSYTVVAVSLTPNKTVAPLVLIINH